MRLLLSCLVFGALAPSVSRALVAGSGDWVEICTANGSRWVKLTDTGNADGPDAPAQAHAGGGDCPYCRLQHELPALPTQPAVTPVVPAGGPPTTAATRIGALPRCGWLRPPAHAPPRA